MMMMMIIIIIIKICASEFQCATCYTSLDLYSRDTRPRIPLVLVSNERGGCKNEK